MKHYPAQRHPPPLNDLSHTRRSPLLANRTTRWLLAATIFAAGFFSGAILFGLVLTASIGGAP